MERNVNIVLDKVDLKHDQISEFSAKRSQRYKSPPKAILRHIILSDFKEKVPLAPFINKDTEPILMYDPLPPIDSINIYNRYCFNYTTKPKNLFHKYSFSPSMTSASRVLMDSSPFSMFFQSLLPNFNVQELAAAGPANADRPAIDPVVRDGNNPADIDGEGNIFAIYLSKLLLTQYMYRSCIQYAVFC